jgi:hypothetical protein
MEDKWQTDSPVDSATIARISASIRQDLKPVHPMPAPRFLRMGAALISVLVTGLFWARAGLGGWYVLSGIQQIAATIYLVLALGLLVYVFVCSLQPGSVVRIRPWFAISFAFLGLVAFSLGLLPVNPGLQFVSHGWICLSSGLGVFIVTSAATLLLTRFGWAIESHTTGALAGGIGGVTAVLSLQYACPRQEAMHVFVWHGLVLLLAVLGGYLVGGLLINRIHTR